MTRSDDVKDVLWGGILTLVFLMCGCSSPTLRTSSGTNLYFYDSADIDRFVSHFGFSDEGYVSVVPNSQGNRLSLIAGDGSRVLVLPPPPAQPVVRPLPPAHQVWLNDEGVPVAWWIAGEPMVHLAGGHELRVFSGSRNNFRVDASGRFAAAVNLDWKQLDLFRLSAEGATLIGTVEDFEGWMGNFFVDHESRAYIEAIVPVPDGSARQDWCTLHPVEGGYTIVSRRPLPGQILSADIESGWAYVRETDDLGWGRRWLINLRTGESRSLGRRSWGIPVFLQDDLLRQWEVRGDQAHE